MEIDIVDLALRSGKCRVHPPALGIVVIVLTPSKTSALSVLTILLFGSMKIPLLANLECRRPSVGKC